MSKAIYGLAMRFNVFHPSECELMKMPQYELTDFKVTELWKELILTINHNRSQTLGNTSDNNLSIQMNNEGLFFRYIPESEEGLAAYKKVKEGMLTKCSVTYLRKTERDYELERIVQSLAMINDWESKFLVVKQTETLVHEICLTNTPGDKGTFCTTDKSDPRLEGVRWNG